MILDDIHNSNIDENNIVDVNNENNFTLKIYNIDKSINIYKYNNERLLKEDIRKINNNKNQILYG